MEKAKQIRDVMSEDIPTSEVRLSKLLELALRDMKIISKDSRYVLNMSEWYHFHESRTGGFCEVCMAGSVMVNSLTPRHLSQPKLSSKFVEANLYPGSFTPKISTKLQVINELRQFDINAASYRLNGFKNSLAFNRNEEQEKIVMKYRYDSPYFFKSVKQYFFKSMKQAYEDIIQDPMSYIKVYDKFLEDLKSVNL